MSARTDSPVPAGTRRTPATFGVRISRRQYLVIAIAVFVGLVLVWGAATGTGLISPLFLPSPWDVVAKLGEHARKGELAKDVLVSTYRIFVGYLIATAMALPLGVLTGVSAKFEAALEPLVDFVRYMPVVAFVPLTILWVGTGDAQKFLIIWLGTFFQQVLLISDAVRQVPRSLVSLGQTLGLRGHQVLVRIVVPAAAPRIWDALRVSLGWAWTWLVVAELVAATSGMGYRITVAQRYFATDTIIGYVIVLGVLGLVFDQVMRWLGRKFFSYDRGRR